MKSESTLDKREEKLPNLTISIAQELDFEVKSQISQIFVDGFFEWLQYFSKDKNKLVAAFTHSFLLEDFFLAHEDQEVLAMAALRNGKSAPLKLEVKPLIKHLGFVKGLAAYLFLKKEFEKQSYPFEMADKMASIEFVATKSNRRGRGLATELLKRMMNQPEIYVLEVASSNHEALKLYEKLGFETFKTVKAPKQAGFEHYIYMKADKTKP
ncbi:GNAT family N-acetyltransferase [Lactococcus ileimucosae]|uniref:GNAT family N-acetyltransferase n=1 Tax=Lactococcus ileimucosae TaxID=2941329 RepID=UPI0020431F0A|nr:GNAT family N-acetyltransferase [Lactococcus ileimucosae]